MPKKSSRRRCWVCGYPICRTTNRGGRLCSEHAAQLEAIQRRLFASDLAEKPEPYTPRRVILHGVRFDNQALPAEA